MSVETLINRIGGYNSDADFDFLRRSYEFAEKAHRGQWRQSGEPYFTHCIATANVLTELKLDVRTVSAGLLHDVIEDTSVTRDELANLFGETIAQLVQGVSKIGRYKFRGGAQQRQAENYLKLLLATAEDIRVILIKLADRLHNMETLSFLSLLRQQAISKETLEVYAPIAHRLGIWRIMSRLEDLAFKHLYPAEYRDIAGLLAEKLTEREAYVDKMVATIEKELNRFGIKASVHGRTKHIYSIYQKSMKYESEGKGPRDIFDLYALRVLVKSKADCYNALGVVHNLWRPIPGQFDDYVANPKDNLYQSLHTAVLCEDALPVEIQIRTTKMHKLAEYGVAAHWLYKEGDAPDPDFDRKIQWLRETLEQHRDVDGPVEFVESFKNDTFKNQVFVYTPKGELRELPVGASPLDFAYRIHTDVGHRCIGSKVNGRLVALNYSLQNGDTVEIMTSKTERGPSLDWLNQNRGYVKTASARAKVRQWFNRQTRQVNIERGRDIFNRELRRLNTSLDDLDVARLVRFDTVDEFFAALGGGAVTTSHVVERLSSEEVKPDAVKPVVLPAGGPGTGITVMGTDNLFTRLAMCCEPIRGDDIKGYITRNRGVTVHKSSCQNVLRETEVYRLTPVGWGEERTLYPVRLRLEAWNRVGLLRDVSSLVSEERVNIASCVSEETDDLSIISLTVFIDGIRQLSHLFAKLEGIDGVLSVSRTSASA
jgi:guanosine-3',5'-bis(diphosphate) 3'-pyrophosphohydrolase